MFNPLIVWRGFTYIGSFLTALAVTIGTGANSVLGAPAIEKKLQPILYLDFVSLPELLDRTTDYGVLRRELYRQALLIAAREELGLQTRDAVLRELPPENLPSDNQLRFMLALPPGRKGWVALQRGPIEKPEVLGRIEFIIPPGGHDWEKVVEQAEKLSRGEFVDWLKNAGFSGETNKPKTGGPLPEAAEKSLGQLGFISQYSALRDLHHYIRTKGESLELLGGLVRAYSNLGILTEHQWHSFHKVFKARALLYAQRMVVQQGDKALTGTWHRAYAFALTGCHKAALDDLENAKEDLRALKSGKELPRNNAPIWAPLIDAYSHFETDHLADAAKDAKQAQLAGLLQFLSVEHHETLHLTVKTARQVLEKNPECYRVSDALADFGGLGNQHEFTVSNLKLFTETVPVRLAEIPDLPESVAKMIKNKAGEPKVLQALAEAGRLEKEADPTWTILARLAQDVRFLMTYRRLHFMSQVWSVPVDDYVQEALPLIATDHPYRPLIASYILNPERDREEYQKQMKKIKIQDPDWGKMDLLRSYTKLDTGRFAILTGRALRMADNTFHDMILFFRYASNPQVRIPIAHQSLKVSPFAPVAITALIDDDWKFAQEKAKGWEQASQHPLILKALGHRYLQNAQAEDAERCFRKCMELSPDKSVYMSLADSFKKQGKIDQWKKTLDTYLEKEESHGLDHAQVQIEIAKYFMSQEEWKKAQPYADKAAATGAGWAMLAASECYEGLEDWDKAEELVRSAAERYDDGRFRWYTWCRRTGRGDIDAAEKLLLKHVEGLDGRYSREDLSALMVYYVLARHLDKAVETIDKLLKQGPNETLSLLKIILLDEQGKDDARDQAIKQFPDKPSYFGQVVGQFADCLAKGEKGKLDERALQRILKSLAPDRQTEICYFVAKFLEKHGDKDDAVTYFQRISRQPEPKAGLFKTLAWVNLHDRGITPEKPEVKK